MIAPLGTLAFLATMWLLVVVGAAVLEESGAKIAAALKGETAPQPPVVQRAVRIRMRPAIAPKSASPRWRAAA